MTGPRAPNSIARLTDEEKRQLLVMRETMTAEQITRSPLARKHGLSRSAVLGICRRMAKREAHT